eukprot:938443-Pleurochrysis_carterae.AAC.4
MQGGEDGTRKTRCVNEYRRRCVGKDRTKEKVNLKTDLRLNEDAPAEREDTRKREARRCVLARTREQRASESFGSEREGASKQIRALRLTESR